MEGCKKISNHQQALSMGLLIPLSLLVVADFLQSSAGGAGCGKYVGAKFP
jgi:hypothetical protein